jgi:hypothetical protein
MSATSCLEALGSSARLLWAALGSRAQLTDLRERVEISRSLARRLATKI